MIYDYENQTLQAKIVYYGPAMSGKTTSIKSLFAYFNRDHNLESIDNSVGRTLFFDFGVLSFKGAKWGLNFLVYSATGQDFYASTRPATLNGVDGIIFVVDSRINHMHHNLRSWNELKTMFRDKIYKMPIVISLNKYDLEQKARIEEYQFIKYVNLKLFKSIFINKTVATEDKGVINAFHKLIKFMFPQLTLKTSDKTPI